MTALLINLKIDQQEKFNLLKTTLTDIETLFDECHIKFRGKLAAECQVFAKELFSKRANFYQKIQEKDWIAATLEMVENIKSRSIFFYLEDHRLIKTQKDLGLVLKDFDKHQLDCLQYSFFKSSRLDIKNLLPLNPKHYGEFSQFILDRENIKLLRKISPLYCIFGLTSICSTVYFKKLLHDYNNRYKIYLRVLSSILTIIFPFPKYRIVINNINYLLSFLNFRLYLSPVDAPFNLEKLIVEINSLEVNSFKNKWKFGVLKNELFANFDDDNNAYGESLIKRGLYPFDINNVVNLETQYHNNFTIKLSAGDSYDCTYHSQIHRIRVLPRMFLKVNYGKVKINYGGKNITLEKNDYRGFYTNLSPTINCLEDAEIILSVYDECFN
jgi:hypothetical protein